VKAENPGASFGEMNKIIGEKWKTISEDRKAKYMEQAAELKKEFDAKEVRRQGLGRGEGRRALVLGGRGGREAPTGLGMAGSAAQRADVVCRVRGP
jgi:hypothetical protein